MAAEPKKITTFPVGQAQHSLFRSPNLAELKTDPSAKPTIRSPKTRNVGSLLAQFEEEPAPKPMGSPKGSPAATDNLLLAIDPKNFSIADKKREERAVKPFVEEVRQSQDDPLRPQVEDQAPVGKPKKREAKSKREEDSAEKPQPLPRSAVIDDKAVGDHNELDSIHRKSSRGKPPPQPAQFLAVVDRGSERAQLSMISENSNERTESEQASLLQSNFSFENQPATGAPKETKNDSQLARDASSANSSRVEPLLPAKAHSSDANFAKARTGEARQPDAGEDPVSREETPALPD